MIALGRRRSVRKARVRIRLEDLRSDRSAPWNLNREYQDPRAQMLGQESSGQGALVNELGAVSSGPRNA